MGGDLGKASAVVLLKYGNFGKQEDVFRQKYSGQCSCQPVPKDGRWGYSPSSHGESPSRSK